MKVTFPVSEPALARIGRVSYWLSLILTSVGPLTNPAEVKIRPVESKSLKVGKSLKIGKKSDKIGKIRINFLLDFFRLFGNLLKRSVIGTLDLKREPFGQSGILLIYNFCSQNACTSI